MRKFVVGSVFLVGLIPLVGCDYDEGGDSVDGAPDTIDGAPGSVDAGPNDPDGAPGSDRAYPIVDTNQTACYDPSGATVACAGSGQDGAFLGNQPSYTDNGDGTVTDQVTGLMWQQGMDAKQFFYDGESYCASLAVGGHDDWRVPTIKELYSLIDFSGSTGLGGFDQVPQDAIPYIDTNYFDFEYGDTDAGERFIDAQWLSSNVYVADVMGGEECAFGVNFADGRIKCYPTRDLPFGGFYFRCVRGNQSYGQNDLVDNGDDTISDQATGLMWMQQDSESLGAGNLGDGTMDWPDALDYCEDLVLAGHEDWRLPNAKELQSLVDYSRSPDTTGSAAISPLLETGSITNEAGQADFAFYWTGTTHLDGMPMGGSGIYVSFGRGMGQMQNVVMDVHGAGCQRGDPKTGSRADYPKIGMGPQGDAQRVFNHVRCVR